ncbi:MAG: hypothetical protein R3B36_31905 [Polyangiaceae bacterium]
MRDGKLKLGVGAAAAAVVCVSLLVRACGTPAPVETQDPKEILGRVWFDKLPATRKDPVDVWIFLGGGIGIEDKGSFYKFTIEMFDLERRGSELEIAFLQDGKKAKTTFDIKPCDDKPPFNRCLTFSPPLRGVSKLYGFAYDDEMDAHVAWGRSVRRTAEARARER